MNEGQKIYRRGIPNTNMIRLGPSVMIRYVRRKPRLNTTAGESPELLPLDFSFGPNAFVGMVSCCALLGGALHSFELFTEYEKLSRSNSNDN